MITFLKLGKFGRFGNQLFQYAALRSLGLKQNCEIGIPNLNNTIHHNQKNLLKYLSIPEDFFGKAKFYHKILQKKFVFKETTEVSHKFYKLEDGTDILGYFQSIYYFKDYVDLIRKELKPKDNFIYAAKTKINQIKSKYPGYQIVSLHLRRGDITVGDYSEKNIDYYGGKFLDFKSMNGSYLKRAKSIFKKKKVKFLVFSGGSTNSDNNGNDLNWCKENLKGDEYIFLEPQTTIEDFSLISQCDHNIISRTSTFGWWAAYLNNSKKAIIVTHKIYDPERPDKKRYMFYPKKWILV